MTETFFHQFKLAVAVAAALGACGAHAASIRVKLDSVAYVSPPAGNSIDFSASTATWVYDPATGVLTGSGLFSIDSLFTPTTDIFEHRTVDPVFTAGNAASATSFACIEGGFGAATSSHSCGGWDFGPNTINESSITYGPGTSFTLTMGGDDVSNVSPVSISHYDNMPATWDGTILVFSNTKVAAAGLAYDITFTAVPVPATVWLFGSALGLLGWLRRKARPLIRSQPSGLHDR
jgi:hypothetical protein